MSSCSRMAKDEWLAITREPVQVGETLCYIVVDQPDGCELRERARCASLTARSFSTETCDIDPAGAAIWLLCCSNRPGGAVEQETVASAASFDTRALHLRLYRCRRHRAALSVKAGGGSACVRARQADVEAFGSGNTPTTSEVVRCQSIEGALSGSIASACVSRGRRPPSALICHAVARSHRRVSCWPSPSHVGRHFLPAVRTTLKA